MQEKPAIKGAGGKVFALDYGLLMGGPFDLFDFLPPMGGAMTAAFSKLKR
jgi:hypothetical protein